MIEPTEADIDREVIYRPGHPGAVPEHGRITSFNDRYVFVRYGNSGAQPQATARQALEWGSATRIMRAQPSQ